MAAPLWITLPEAYARCERCNGTGDVPCRWCDGRGSTVGLDPYLYGRTVSRRVGLKRCSYCHGRGTHRCAVCIAGSVERPDAAG
jgi:hypothetical protein